MKCSACGKKAVIDCRYEGKSYCKKHFLFKFERRVRKTVRVNKLIESGDRIAVAISGGKDSTSMLYILNELTKNRADVSIFAVLVDEGIKGYRDKSIKSAKKYCKQIGVELHIVSFKDIIGINMDDVVLKNKDETLNSCTFCGVFRRHCINYAALKHGAIKVAIGHNLDDESQSIMANYIRGDMLRAVRVGAKSCIVEDERFVPRIKPLRDVLEKEVALFAILNEFPVCFDECKYASGSFRWEIREHINALEENHPGTKYSIVNTFDSMLPFLKEVYFKKVGTIIKKCGICGGPTSQNICKLCILKKKLGLE